MQIDGGMYRILSAWLSCLLALGLQGCASTLTRPLTDTQPGAPLKLLVVETPMQVDARRLQQVLAPDAKHALSASDEPLLSGAQHAQAYAAAEMDTALARQPSIEVVTPPPSAATLLARWQGLGAADMPTQEEADRLRAATGADALLRFRITDYGLTPRAWRNAYIAFEVTTTLAIAAVIAYAGPKVAKAAAGVYLVQETAEEAATAYAGFDSLDETARPVRISAELVALNPVGTIWQTSHTGLSDIKLSRLYRKVGADEINLQLGQATADAAKKTAADLAYAMKASAERLRMDKVRAQLLQLNAAPAR